MRNNLDGWLHMTQVLKCEDEPACRMGALAMPLSRCEVSTPPCLSSKQASVAHEIIKGL